jgi:hypothetical protein
VTSSVTGEHRADRGWLRENRLRIAILIGIIETIAIVFSDATWFWALALAVIGFMLYFFVGRERPSGPIRDLTWIGAASQVLPVLIPVLVSLVSVLALVVVGVVAALIAGMLYLDRR